MTPQHEVSDPAHRVVPCIGPFSPLRPLNPSGVHAALTAPPHATRAFAIFRGTTEQVESERRTTGCPMPMLIEKLILPRSGRFASRAGRLLGARCGFPNTSSNVIRHAALRPAAVHSCNTSGTDERTSPNGHYSRKPASGSQVWKDMYPGRRACLSVLSSIFPSHCHEYVSTPSVETPSLRHRRSYAVRLARRL